MLSGVSEEQFCKLATSWRIAMVILDKNYVISYVNDELCRIDGRSSDELVGKTFREVWPVPAVSDTGKFIRLAMEDRTVESGNFIRFERSDKKIRWVDFRAVPWGDGVATFSIDITQRRVLELEISDMESKFAEASRVTTDIIYEWDMLSDTVRLSQAGCRLLNAKPVNGPGAAWWHSHIHPEDRQRTIDNVQNALKLGAIQWSDEYRFMIQGQYALIHERAYITYDPDGKPIKAMGGISDITEVRNAQEKVKQLQNELIHVSRVSAMGTLASVLAHELNQPLAATGTYLAGAERLLLSDKPDIGMAIDGIRQAREGAHRAGEIIRQMRSLTKKSEMVKQHVNLLEAVKDASDLILVGRADQAQQLQIQVPEALTVYADTIQLQQVLINLIKNAFEANDEVGGELVLVSANRVSQNEIDIIVEDRGPGIPEATKEQLFHFFMSTKQDGLGVGLPISLSIVEAHGGHLKAANNDGPGAVFTMRMICRDEKEDNAHVIY